MAGYNQGMNESMYSAAAKLSAADLIDDRGAFFGSVMGTFNHQTHHRGQVSTLLNQFGIDVGVTDLLVQIPSEA